jgi:WD40 repeat protein
MKTDDSVKIWDTHKWTITRSFDPSELARYGALTQMSSASEDQLIAVLTKSGEHYTTIYDIAAGKNLFHLNEEYSSRVGFDSSSMLLAAYSRRQSHLVLWDMTLGAEVDTIPADEFGGVLKVSPNGQFITWNARGRVMLFDRTTRVTHTIYYDTPYRLPLTAFSPDSAKLAVTNRDGIRLYETSTGKILTELSSTSYDYRSLDFSRDGHTIAVNYDYGSTVDIWDLQGI